MSSVVCLIAAFCFNIFCKHRNVADVQLSNGKAEVNNVKKEKFLIALKQVIMNKRFLFMCILFMILELSFDFVSFNASILGESMKRSPAMIGLASSAYFVTYSLFQVPVNNYLKRLTTFKALVIMGALSMMSIIPLIINASFELVIVGMALCGITIGSLFTYFTVIVAEAAPSNKKGLHLGIFNMIMPLTDTISPVIVAFLFGISPRYAFILSAFLFFLFLIIVFLRKDKINEGQ